MPPILRARIALNIEAERRCARLKENDLIVLVAVWEFLSGIIVLIGVACIGAFAFPAVIDLSGASQAGALFGLSLATLVLLGYAALSIAAGIGLITRKEWGRITGIIHAALSLLSVPVGTIIGILVLVYLTRRRAKEYFEAAAA
jgi:hypothetical protein